MGNTKQDDIENQLESKVPERLTLSNLIKTKTFWISMMSFIVLIILYGLMIKFNLEEIQDRKLKFNYENSLNSTTIDSLDIELRVLSLDLLKNQMDIHLTFNPTGELVKEGGKLKESVLVAFPHYQKAFEANSTMNSIQAVLPILSGSASYYPFDIFSTDITLQVTQSTTSIPYSISLIGRVVAYHFSMTKQSFPSNPTLPQLLLSIKRPASVQAYSVFIVIVMWLLTLAMSGLAIRILFKRERPGASYLGLGSALLFALPSLRNTQPGIPPIGILIDAIGFCWNMILVALATITMLSIWLLRYPLKAKD